MPVKFEFPPGHTDIFKNAVYVKFGFTLISYILSGNCNSLLYLAPFKIRVKFTHVVVVINNLLFFVTVQYSISGCISVYLGLTLLLGKGGLLLERPYTVVLSRCTLIRGNLSPVASSPSASASLTLIWVNNSTSKYIVRIKGDTLCKPLRIAPRTELALKKLCQYHCILQTRRKLKFKSVKRLAQSYIHKK